MPRWELIISFSILFPFICGSDNQDKRSPFDRSSDNFFLVGIWIKYKIKYCYATDMRMRRIRGPPSQKIDILFFTHIIFYEHANKK